jgi:hypothetical protein
MTYFIETERDGTSKRNVVLVWSIVCTRHKNIGTAAEFVNEDPALAKFSYPDQKWKLTKMTVWLTKSLL